MAILKQLVVVKNSVELSFRYQFKIKITKFFFAKFIDIHFSSSTFNVHSFKIHSSCSLKFCGKNSV